MRNTDINRLIFLGFAGFLILALGCRDNKISRVPVSNFYDSCDTEHYFGELITIGDPNDKFMITLPYEWDIREQYADSVYGIIAANFLSIPQKPEDQLSLSVFGYKTEKGLQEYFEDELLELMQDDNIIVEERGISAGDPIEFPWVKFVQKVGGSKVFNLVLYAKLPDNDEIFLLQSSVYHSDKVNVKLCYLKQLMSSFKLGFD